MSAIGFNYRNIDCCIKIMTCVYKSLNANGKSHTELYFKCSKLETSFSFVKAGESFEGYYGVTAFTYIGTRIGNTKFTYI